MENKIKRFWIENGYIYILNKENEVYRQSMDEYPTLRDAPSEDWMAYEISNSGIHWRICDTDISYDSFIEYGEGPLLSVFDAEYLGDSIMKVEFSDGSIKRVDLSGELVRFQGKGRYGFSPIEEFALERGNIKWANGTIFPVDYLYRIGKTINTGKSRLTNLKSFFATNKAISVSGFARQIGINPTLMLNYVNGYKIPSENRLRQIEEGIKRLGEMCMAIDLGIEKD